MEKMQQARPSRVCNRLFLLTGFDAKQKDKLVEMIVSLGAKHQETVEFVRDCTHVISAKPIRSEKYLCGCASGRWVLTANYVRHSFRATKWLDEEKYEWSATGNLNGYPREIVAAPRRWRLHIKDQRKAAFNDWSVYLRVEDKHRRPLVYKRLIVAGGGKTVSNLPSGDKKPEGVTHVIVDRCYLKDVEVFAAAGVPCLHPEYLAEFLFEVNPSMEPYQFAWPPEPEAANRAVRAVTAPTGRRTRGRAKRALQKLESQSQKLADNKVAENQEMPSRSKPESSSPSSLETSETSFKATKRKLQTLGEIEEALEARKRRKMDYREPCVPPWVRSAYKTYKSKDHEPSVPFSHAQLNVIEASIEEGEWFTALVTLQSYLSTRYHPPSELLHQIMQQILQTNDANLAMACLKVLQATLCMHSPSLNPEMTQVYLDALLAGPKEVKSLYRYMTSTDCWDYIHHVLKLAFQQCSISKASSSQDDASTLDGVNSSAILLLEFLVYQIEEDYTAWKNRKENNLATSKHGCMIARIMWPGAKKCPSNMKSVPFKQLLRNTVKALALTIDHSQDVSKQLRCLKHVLSLLNMAAEYLIQWGVKTSPSELNLSSNLITEFSASVASHLIDTNIHENPEQLSLFLSKLKPQWLKLTVVQCILDQKHQSMLEKREAERLRTSPLTLRKIVDYYFWMVPQFKTPAPKLPARTAKIETKVSSGKLLLKPLGDSNIDKSRRQKDVKTEKDMKAKQKMTLLVNKRNPKGETPLQVACIRNQLDKVKQLLAVPGINVNAEDFAGWTPLHEAASHGHWACIQELIRFRPKPDSTGAISKPVNLLAAPSECGTTALHDAVFHNYLECAKLLVKAGGQSVLQAKNKFGFTPVHMAETEEMKRVLNQAEPSDHNKENHGAVVRNVPNELLSVMVIGEQDSSVSLSEHQYINLLGPRGSRREVLTEQQCECFCILSLWMVSSYIGIRELNDIRLEMIKVRDDPEWNESSIPSPVVKKESLRSSQASAASSAASSATSSQLESAEDVLSSQQSENKLKASRFGAENETLVKDMEVFTSLRKHVRQFVQHVERLGAWENGLGRNKRCRTAVKSMKALCH